MGRWVLALLALTAVVAVVQGVDRGKFKTCAQSGFCKRNRAYASADGSSPYAIVEGSEKATQLKHTYEVRNRATLETFTLEITHYGDGVVRTQLFAADQPKPYSPEEALVPSALPTAFKGASSNGRVFGAVDVQYDPLKLSFYAGEELVMEANADELLNVETGKQAGGEEEGRAAGYKAMERVEMGEESFGSHKDSKPRGPTSISLDFTFPHSQHLYGIPEHASDLRLKSTEGTEPFRLYNLDVFEYELDETMALYGAIPFLLSHRTAAGGGSLTTGMFWVNAAETWVDVRYGESPRNARTHWFSESGMVDFFVMLGPSAKDVFRQYTDVTGKPQLPPVFSIAYHQCRWNYKDEADVAEVDRQMDAHNIPYDVIWLDIEHTNGKRYFTWDPQKFPTPEQMQANVASKGRRMVTIVDPHIKNDNNYWVHAEASANGLYVKNKDGESDFEGWCWPGSSSYLDFSDAAVRTWWGDQFAYSQYKGSTEALFTWNDMNEPSVFNGPEVTMQKDVIHAGGVEHRDLHNIFGMFVHMATADGLTRRNADQNARPFVLSRAFFAGSQRFGAIWTGDNTASWGHMQASMPMLMSMGVSGLPFVGGDVGGFFGNPDQELLARWYQLGAYQPFFRAHAHLDTKRREPYLFDEHTTDVIRAAVRARYALLPFWYTQFYHTFRTGTPMMRPVWVEYPEDPDTFSLQDEYLLGGDLLVAPALTAGATEVTVYFPGHSVWYDVQTFAAITHHGYQKVAAPFEKIPVFQRGGSIIPKKLRPRRSSTQMAHDPYTLVVAVALDGTAAGDLYLDDGVSFDFARGHSSMVDFTYEQGVLRSSVSLAAYETSSTVERIILMGLATAPTSATVTVDGHSTNVAVGAFGNNAYMVRNPDVSILKDWSVELNF